MKHYYIQHIRALLTDGFTDEELRQLIYQLTIESPSFIPVYAVMRSQTPSKKEIVAHLLDLTRREDLFETLLELLKKLNPVKYEQHQPYYDEPTSVSSEPKSYNLRNVRRLLTEGFTDAALRRLAYALPDFRPVYEALTPNSSKTEIIDRLIEFVEQKGLFETLLALLKKLNPAKYKKYQPYHDESRPNIQGNAAISNISYILYQPRDGLIHVYSEPKSYNLRNVRQLLTEGFTDEELRRLAYDSQSFRPVYEALSPASGKAEIVDRLLEFAERKGLIETLLAWVKERNPAKFETHQPYYYKFTPVSPETSQSAQLESVKTSVKDEFTSIWLLPEPPFKREDLENLAVQLKLGTALVDKISAKNSSERNVSILNDLPASEDTLGIQHLVLAISNIILAETTETPITIGINGAWGTGKTSLLKMIERKAQTLDFQCIWLNAWSLESVENLMATVNTEMQRILHQKDQPKVSASESPMLPVTTRSSFETQVQILLTDNAYEHSRLLVFIDDIDRALPDQIATILKNLKLILEVERCVFVLAMDMDIVARSIENYYRNQSQRLSLINIGRDMHVQGDVNFMQQSGDQSEEAIRPGFGYKYLEKIVQLIVEVPDLTRDQIYAYLNNLRIAPQTLEIVHWAPDEDILNPRRLKRYINWLNISLQLIISTLIPKTIRNITALRAMALQRDYPEIYRYLLESSVSDEQEFRSLLRKSLVSRRNFTQPFEEEITEFANYLNKMPLNELAEFNQFVRRTPMLNGMRREYRYSQVINWDEPTEQLRKDLD